MTRKINIEKKTSEVMDIITQYNIPRLNVGCGWENFPNKWFNIGLFLEKRIMYGEIKILEGAHVFHYDLRGKMPIEEETIEAIYGSHFIEHFRIDEGTDLLKRMNNVMRPDAILRLSTPDLELWIEKYYKNDTKFFKNFYKISPAFPQLSTKGGIFVGQIHGWGHKWLYDFETLHDCLEKAGFVDITRKKLHDSKLEDIKEMEPVNKVRLFETMYVEARKP